MAIAQRLHQSQPKHQAYEHEAAVWVMILILFGLTCFAFASLLSKV